MTDQYRFSLILVVCMSLAVLFPPARGEAHRLSVFAYPDKDEIVVTASFGHDRPVVGGEVRATRDDGRVVFTGKTDNRGELRFPRPEIPPGKRLTITVKGGPGHQGTWLLTPEDLGGHQTPAGLAAPSENLPAKPSGPQKDQQDLDQIVTRAVAREIAPLKAMLASHMESGTSWRNIIGGIGWIVGLAGLWAILSHKRTKDNDG